MDDTTLRQFLNQMCLDGQMDDEEIDEFLDVMMDKVIPEIREPLEQQINELKGYVQHTKKCQQYALRW